MVTKCFCCSLVALHQIAVVASGLLTGLAFIPFVERTYFALDKLRPSLYYCVV